MLVSANRISDKIRDDRRTDDAISLLSESKINLEGATCTLRVIRADNKVIALIRSPNLEKSSGFMVAINNGKRGKLVNL